jgi:hypothetical protein
MLVKTRTASYDTTELIQLFTVRNNWRMRNVVAYQHPNNLDKLITVGHPFDGGDPVVCEEDKADYPRQMDLRKQGQTHSIYD